MWKRSSSSRSRSRRRRQSNAFSRCSRMDRRSPINRLWEVYHVGQASGLRLTSRRLVPLLGLNYSREARTMRQVLPGRFDLFVAHFPSACAERSARRRWRSRGRLRRHSRGGGFAMAADPVAGGFRNGGFTHRTGFRSGFGFQRFPAFIPFSMAATDTTIPTGIRRLTPTQIRATIPTTDTRLLKRRR